MRYIQLYHLVLSRVYSYSTWISFAVILYRTQRHVISVVNLWRNYFTVDCIWVCLHCDVTYSNVINSWQLQHVFMGCQLLWLLPLLQLLLSLLARFAIPFLLLSLVISTFSSRLHITCYWREWSASFRWRFIIFFITFHHESSYAEYLWSTDTPQSQPVWLVWAVI